jgi:hypothetical protein
VRRITSGATTSFDDQVAAYDDMFKKLKDDFLNKRLLATQITVSQFSSRIDGILTDICKKSFLSDARLLH